MQLLQLGARRNRNSRDKGTENDNDIDNNIDNKNDKDIDKNINNGGYH